MKYTCLECNLEFEKQKHLIFHLKKIHTFSYEDYVIKHFFNNSHPTCKCGCGTPMKFESHNANFFKEFTKNHFPRKPHTEETKKRIKETYTRVMLEKYGVDNPMKIPEFIDKIATTKEDKYGDRTYNNLDKQRQTFLERYGNEKFRNTEKMMETNLKKFGAKTYTSTEKGKAQIKETKKQKYGDENYTNIEKQKQTKLERYGYECEFLDKTWRNQYNRTDSKIQLKVQNDLNGGKFIYHGFEFDVKFDKFLIEVDGDAYHPTTLDNMNLIQLTSSGNDFKKTRLIEQSDEYKLLRVKSSELRTINRIISFEDIWESAYCQDFTFNYYTKFVTKEHLVKIINKKSKESLSKYWSSFYRFIRLFQANFPEIETQEILPSVIDKIQKYNLNKILLDKTFNNNSSCIGVSYLKSKFKSYWKSSYKNSKSPVEAWADKRIMERVIKYRIGLNNCGEVFNFSLHQLVRGLSAHRLTISFFKPILAASIYQHFLGNKDCPIVFDPCAGFGGRLLGFKSLYPNGTYIGCEPNIETFNELIELSKNFSNIQLFNCKIEDFDKHSLPENVDMSFTSIPYYDIETYSNPILYSDFEDWKETFIVALKSLPNLIVNVPLELRNCFETDCDEYYISSNTSHFNKNQKKKFEYLLSFKKDL